MNETVFHIEPNIIVLSFYENKNYILSKSDTSLDPLNYRITDKSKTDPINECIKIIQDHVLVSLIDIDIRLLELHSREIETYKKTNNVLYPVFGAVIPYIDKLSDCYWKEFSFLVPNPLSYSITRVAQTIVL